MTCPAITTVLNLPFGMTVYTPWHLEGGHPSDPVHSFHGAVALLAFQTGLDMSLMGEVYKVWYIMHLYPGYGFLFFPIFIQLLYFRTIGRDDLMATHAFTDARNTCGGGLVGVSVAIHTRDLVLADMYAVAESNGLYRTDIGIKFDLN